MTNRGGGRLEPGEWDSSETPGQSSSGTTGALLKAADVRLRLLAVRVREQAQLPVLASVAHTKGGKGDPGVKDKERQLDRERAAAAAAKQQLGIKCVMLTLSLPILQHAAIRLRPIRTPHEGVEALNVFAVK